MCENKELTSLNQQLRPNNWLGERERAVPHRQQLARAATATESNKRVTRMFSK